MALKEQVIKKSALSPTILIAGGAGFIGSHLAEVLLQKDVRVIVLDNFKTGKDVYISSLLDNPKFAFFDADLNKGIPKNIESVDYIIHLAGVESYLYSRDQISLDSLLTNAIGTKNLLDLAKKSAAKFLLVSSVDVYQGLLSPTDLDRYFGETEELEQKYSLNEAKRYAEALVWEYYKKHQIDVRIVRLPEVYGPRMNLNSSGNLGRLLNEFLEKEEQTIYGEGTQKEYYLYITDTITGLVKSLFNNHTNGKIFTLAPHESHTALEVAYLLKGVADKGVEVKFKPRSDHIPASSQKIPDRGEIRLLKWHPRVSFEEGIKRTLKWFGYDVNTHSFKPNKLIDQKKKERSLKTSSITSLASGISPKIKPKIKTTPTQKQRKKIKIPKIPTIKLSFKPKKPELLISVLAVILLFVVFTVVPLLQLTIHTKVGVNLLQKVPVALAEMDTQKAKDTANKAFQNLNKAQNALKRTKWLFALAGQQDYYRFGSSTLSSATYISKSVYNVSKAVEPFVNVWYSIKPNTTIPFDKEGFENSKISFGIALENLEFAKADVQNIDKSILSEKLLSKVNYYESALLLLSDYINAGAVFASDIPNLLGTNNLQKRYMVLFQNNNEIRPTGGFIGSYAIVELRGGRIESLTIDDVYNPDGQLDVKEINVTQPTVLKELLNEDKFYIRNANWNPDFVQSSNDIKNLYTKATGDKLDGVIAVDLYFVQRLLETTGPVYLAAYGEEINSENFYEKTQYYSEFNYKNGSDQKREFLTILGSKLLESLFTLPEEKMSQLLTVTKKSLDERHVLVSVFNSVTSTQLTNQRWDGSLIQTDNDYLYVVNANVGGTKANYFVKNSMDYVASSKTRDGLLRAELKLTYKHTGADNSWPGGPYKNYVRVLAQKGAKLTNAEMIVGDKAQTIFEQVAIDTVGGYTSFEYLIELQAQQNGVLIFYYDLPEDLSITANNKDYSLYWQKQPGTQKDTVNVSFTPPFGTNITSTAINGTLQSEEATTWVYEPFEEDWYLQLTFK